MSENPFRFFTTNDQITLEYDDAVLFTYTPEFPDLVDEVESTSQEFIRDSAIVYIEDNDRK